MTGGEFRFAFFARDYDRSLAYYRDGLELPIRDSWDRGPDDQGTVFRAASGLIEVLRLPRLQEPDGVWDYRAPQGAWIVVEADDVDAWYGRVVEKGLPIKEPLMDQEWGHRSFRLVDPDGIELFVFSNINV